MDTATLELLWARFLDGDELDPAEEELLADALDDDPELRSRFLRDHEIDTALQWASRTELGQSTFVASVLQKWSNPHANTDAPPSHVEAAPPSLGWARRGREIVRWFPSAVAAALLLGAVGLVWRSSHDVAVAPLGTLVLNEQAEWDGAAPKTQITAEPMHLKSGTVQMLLAGGVQVTAAGPARWQLQSEGRLLALLGKFKTIVPKRAIGFAIQTPTAVIVDLGTEFDVQVEPDGGTSVFVESGAVELATIPQGGAPSIRWRLGAGERRRVDRHGAVDPDATGEEIEASPNAPKGSRSVEGSRDKSEPQPVFRGALALDGQVREFDNEAAFRQALANARSTPPKNAPVGPLARSEPAVPTIAAARQANLQAQQPPEVALDPLPRDDDKRGCFTCNGRMVEFDSFEEFDDRYHEFTSESENFKMQLEAMQKQMFKQFEQMGIAFPHVFRNFGVVNATLRGSITWDDKRWEFSDRKELERARLQLRRHLTSAKANAKATPEPKAKPAADKAPAKPAKERDPAKSANRSAPFKNWHGIAWHTNVADACKQAAGGPGPEDDKPAFVFRVLGDLEGFM